MKKALKARNFTMHIHKMEDGNTYTSVVRPILEYGAASWGPRQEGQINTLNWVQNKASQFANHKNYSNWETLAQRTKIARTYIYALFKAYAGKWAWKAMSQIAEGMLFEQD